MRPTKLKGDQVRKAVEYMAEGTNAKLFDGLKPEAMARLAKSSGLGKILPTSKEGMALLVYAFRLLKSNKSLLPMLSELVCERDGRISMKMGNVKQDELDKHSKIIIPGTQGLIKPGDEQKVEDLRKIMKGINKGKR